MWEICEDEGPLRHRMMERSHRGMQQEKVEKTCRWNTNSLPARLGKGRGEEKETQQWKFRQQ